MKGINNWLPYKLITVDDKLQCQWFNTYEEPFAEPFFEETIMKCRSKERKNFIFSSVSDLEIMKEWARKLNNAEPSAIIFHISRCGSTLLSQMLATSDENIVLAEVPFFDDLLRLPFKEPGFKVPEIDKLLISAIKHYGQNGQSKRLFIKTDSWHLFFYEQLRRLFPLVPFILMYRSPDEVFRSHRKQAGMQSVPGLIEPQIFGITADDLEAMSPDVYLARVLENYLSRYLEIASIDNHFLLINYNEGPVEILEKVISFTKIRVDESDLKKMHERSQNHSKKPNEPFHEEKIENIPPCLTSAMELYHLLEEKRKAQ